MWRSTSWRAGCTLAALLIPVAAQAANKTWSAAASGDFGDGANWTGGVPTSVDTATFNVAGTYSVTFDNSPNPLASPVLNQDLFFSAGTVTFTSGSDGAYTYQLTGAGGDDANITGGTLTLGTSGNPLHMAVDDDLVVRGGATLNVTSGSTVSTRDLLIAYTSGGGTGTLVVDGSGSSLTASGATNWGYANTATVTFQNNATGSFDAVTMGGSSGANLTVQSGADVTLRYISFPVGTLTVDGVGSSVTHTSTNGGLVVGFTPPYYYPPTAGVVVNSGALYDAGAATTTLRETGIIILDGGTFRVGAFTDSGGIFEWNSGTLSFAGDLNVDGGGLLGKLLGNNPTLTAGRSVVVSGSTTVFPSHTLTLNGGGLSIADLAVQGTLVLSSGATLAVDSDGHIRVESGGVVNAGVSINGSIVNDSATSTINVTATGVSLGTAASFNGFYHQGLLNIGSNTATLNSAGYARLGVLTTLAGGTINAPNGVYLPGAGNLVGNGAVAARVTGDSGAVIEVDGALALGDAASPAGFNFGGELRTKEFAVTLNSSAQAGLGNLTTLGSGANPGTLNADNGYVLDFAEALTGFGTVNSTNTLAKRAIINGTVQGNSPTQPITLSGYVKGIGAFDNVNFTGTFDPGLSPTILSVGNVTFSPSSTLIMELGGASPGSGYDQIQSTGTIELDGTLQLSLINGFTPTPGQSFELFNGGTVTGAFSSLELPTLPGLVWNTTELASGTLGVALPGDYNFDGSVDAADYVVWRKGLGTTHTPEDYNIWLANFGRTAGSGGLTHSGDIAGVPEPASLVLWIAALTTIFGCAPRIAVKRAAKRNLRLDMHT